MARIVPQATGGQARAIDAFLGTDDLLGRLLTAADDAGSVRREAAFPDGAAAIIEPACRSVTQSGRGRDKGWVLRFQAGGRSGCERPFGSARSEDPLAHLSLRFPSREAALRYAQRYGLQVEVREPSSRSGVARSTLQPREQPQQPAWICCWPTGPHALCCGRYPLLNGVEESSTDTRK